MTVNELIDELKHMRDLNGGDVEVVMTADYGDICHTTQALTICGVTVTTTRESAYSHSGKAIVTNEDDEEAEETETELEETGATVVALI